LREDTQKLREEITIEGMI
jgi:hypothetical protein